MADMHVHKFGLITVACSDTASIIVKYFPIPA